MQADALILVIKNPEKGKVKTRLALSLGEEVALDIYLRLLAHTRRVALSLDLDRYLYYSDYIEPEDAWPEEAFTKRLQEGRNIGERMYHAIVQTLLHHEKVALIGSDIITLDSSVIREAFDALDEHDFVIGPAKDGGYYLIGMKKAEPSVFSDIEWSTETVFEETLQKLKSLGGSIHILPEMADVDNEDDWEWYKDRL